MNNPDIESSTFHQSEELDAYRKLKAAFDPISDLHKQILTFLTIADSPLMISNLIRLVSLTDFPPSSKPGVTVAMMRGIIADLKTMKCIIDHGDSFS